MLKNYGKIAWRHLLNNRRFTALNLIGLSAGLACTALIFLWVNDELRIDKNHEKDDRLYQVMQNLHETNRIATIEYTPGLLAHALAEEIPGISYATTVVPAQWFFNKGILASGDKQIRAAGQYISQDYYQVFTTRFITGDKRQLLKDKYYIAISDELANKLFGNSKAAIGKSVHWKHVDTGTDFSGDYTIYAVFEKPSRRSTQAYDILLNYDIFVDRRPSIVKWGNSDPSTYVIIKDGINPQQVSNQITDFLKTKYKDTQGTLFLQKFSDRYLHGTYENGKVIGGRIAYVKLFSLIALFILLIACINFMNLSTAKALQRAKEVGVQKVLGANRASLIFQYLAESLLMTLLAFPVAIIITMIVLPEFNAITGKELSLQIEPSLLIGALIIFIVTGIISGSYPAFYLSRFNAATALKGKLKLSWTNVLARKGLVIFQFSLSALLIVAVLVIYRQSQYIQSKNLGYSRDHIISFKKEGRLNESSNAFMNDVKKIPSVVNITTAFSDLLGDHGGTSDISWEGKKAGQSVDFDGLWMDYDFIETLGLTVKEGRSFSKAIGSDTSGIILNEAAIAAMQLKDPIGKVIDCWGPKPIIGVVKDFHYQSLYSPIKPCFLLFGRNGGNMLVKIKAGQESQAIAQLSSLYKKYNPGLPFDYTFLDENYRRLYASEQRVAVLSRYFAGLAILISCLGLFGLAAFTAQRRRKEIGIRKVVGASIGRVAFMLTKDFLKLVGVAVLVAFPLAWWLMDLWLRDFAYRIQISSTIFIIAGGAIILISILTVSSIAFNAARANPVNSLRSE